MSYLAPQALFWHRRDLRVDDNEGLFQALQEGPVDGVFVFDASILSSLPANDRRVAFIHSCVSELSSIYAAAGRRLHVLHGDPISLIARLASGLGASKVFANRDYEPAAIERDDALNQALQTQKGSLELFKDQVIFESDEVQKGSGGSFSVFTPYKNAWIKTYDLAPPPIRDSASALGGGPALDMRLIPPVPSLGELGFEIGDAASLGYTDGVSGGAQALDEFEDKIDAYQADRDFPAKPGVSRLGRHLRFGTLSIRKLAQWARAVGGAGANVWLSELIWREFYSALLSAQPRLALGASFIPALDQLAWDNDPDFLEAWKSGQTGYPIVDAAMRELVATGFMHNRARMVTASFLCKDALCDWRLGEAYFALWLMDFDFASNNGGWQWSASTGCDAQPYFRMFSPLLQSQRFDPNGAYIKRWIPELANCPIAKIHEPSKLSAAEQASYGIAIGVDYPAPMLSHAASRLITLARYKAALKSKA